MTSRLFAIALGMLLAAAPILAQSGDKKADALSGKWVGEFNIGERSRSVSLELKFDGKRKVTGTLSGMPNPADVKAGTFDAKTGALKLELGRQDDTAVLLVLEGTVARGAASGRLTGDAAGEFKLSKADKPK